MSVTINGTVVGTVTDMTAFFNTIFPILIATVAIMGVIYLIRELRGR